MENVAFDLVKKYPPVEPEDFASGWLKNEQFTDYCVEDAGNRCVPWCVRSYIWTRCASSKYQIVI